MYNNNNLKRQSHKSLSRVTGDVFFLVAYIHRYLLLVSAFSENEIPQCSPALVNHFLSFQKSESNKHYDEKKHERKYCNRHQQVAQKSENDLFK